MKCMWWIKWVRDQLYLNGKRLEGEWSWGWNGEFNVGCLASWVAFIPARIWKWFHKINNNIGVTGQWWTHPQSQENPPGPTPSELKEMVIQIIGTEMQSIKSGASGFHSIGHTVNQQNPSSPSKMRMEIYGLRILRYEFNGKWGWWNSWDYTWDLGKERYPIWVSSNESSSWDGALPVVDATRNERWRWRWKKRDDH